LSACCLLNAGKKQAPGCILCAAPVIGRVDVERVAETLRKEHLVA
jgi:hypothetical protein